MKIIVKIMIKSYSNRKHDWPIGPVMWARPGAAWSIAPHLYFFSVSKYTGIP